MNPAAEEILGCDVGTSCCARPLESTVGITGLRSLHESCSTRSKRAMSKYCGTKSSITADGTRRTPLGTSISLMRDPDGATRAVLFRCSRTSPKFRKCASAVRKADRLAAIGELSAGIAHELRNPLASISGSIEMLSGELELEGENQRLMELITRASPIGWTAIINDFLDFARLRFPDATTDIDRPTCLEEVLFAAEEQPR